MSTMDVTEGEKVATAAELAHQRTLTPLARAVVGLGAVASVGLSAYIIFGLGPVLGWWVPLETQYFYMMLGFLLPIVFLIYPLGPGARHYTALVRHPARHLGLRHSDLLHDQGRRHAERGLGVQRAVRTARPSRS